MVVGVVDGIGVDLMKNEEAKRTVSATEFWCEIRRKEKNNVPKSILFDTIAIYPSQSTKLRKADQSSSTFQITSHANPP